MAERPKGYLSKGKTKSPDAARKAKARETFTPKGLGKEVLNAVLSGSPVGRGTGSSSKLMLAIRREMRKKTAGVGQRATVTKNQAQLVASQVGKAPVKRTRNLAKKDSGRGLSAREKQEITMPDTITRPKPNKPKSKIQIAKNKEDERGRIIRNSLTPRVNPARPKRTPKQASKVSTSVASTKPKRTFTEIRDSLKGKKVKTGEKMRMDAQEYFDTRLAQKSAGKDPENSLRQRTRKMETEKAAKGNKKRELEEATLRREERRSAINDIRAGLAKPNRYTTPRKEPGNRIMSERLVDIGLESVKKAEARKALESAAIGKTANAQKKVDATLAAAAKARDAAARRNRINSRKINVRKKRSN